MLDDAGRAKSDRRLRRGRLAPLREDEAPY